MGTKNGEIKLEIIFGLDQAFLIASGVCILIFLVGSLMRNGLISFYFLGEGMLFGSLAYLYGSGKNTDSYTLALITSISLTLIFGISTFVIGKKEKVYLCTCGKPWEQCPEARAKLGSEKN